MVVVGGGGGGELNKRVEGNEPPSGLKGARCKHGGRRRTESEEPSERRKGSNKEEKKGVGFAPGGRKTSCVAHEMAWKSCSMLLIYSRSGVRSVSDLFSLSSTHTVGCCWRDAFGANFRNTQDKTCPLFALRMNRFLKSHNSFLSAKHQFTIFFRASSLRRQQPHPSRSTSSLPRHLSHHRNGGQSASLVGTAGPSSPGGGGGEESLQDLSLQSLQWLESRGLYGSRGGGGGGGGSRQRAASVISDYTSLR